ncbi:MAG: hypothetical protein NTX33_07135 [Propionibacteriales bacterium]|nr:hypothetical protein [Propionibacteriales bacterium]
MTDWDDLTDDQLMAALADAVAEPDPATADRRREAAQAAFTWRTVDAELAELLHDSALEAGAAVRSGQEGRRTLTFGRSGRTLEIEIDGDQVLGEVIADDESAGPTQVILRRPDADDVVVEADASGFVRFSAVAPGLVRFVVERARWSLTTPWVAL